MNLHALLNKADVPLWFRETWERFWSKTPRYIRILGNINLVIAAIGSVPDVLTMLDITLPERWMYVVGRVAFFAGIWVKLNLGTVVSVPTPSKLPFTVKKEIQKLQRDLKEEIKKEEEEVSKSNQV